MLGLPAPRAYRWREKEPRWPAAPAALTPPRRKGKTSFEPLSRTGCELPSPPRTVLSLDLALSGAPPCSSLSQVQRPAQAFGKCGVAAAPFARSAPTATSPPTTEAPAGEGAPRRSGAGSTRSLPKSRVRDCGRSSQRTPAPALMTATACRSLMLEPEAAASAASSGSLLVGVLCCVLFCLVFPFILGRKELCHCPVFLCV